MEYYIYLKLVPINSLKSNIIDFIFIESKKIDSHTIWWVLKVEVKLCFAAMSILLVYPAGPIHASITLFSLAFGIWTAILQWLQFSSFLFICYWVKFILIGTKLLDSLPLIDSVSLKEAFVADTEMISGTSLGTWKLRGRGRGWGVVGDCHHTNQSFINKKFNECPKNSG